MRVAILIPEEAKLSGLVAPIDMLEAANDYMSERGYEKPFDVVLVGQRHRNVHMPQQISFACDHTIDEAGTFDLVIVPALVTRPDMLEQRYGNFINFMKDQRVRGAELASLCTGAFMLAAAGLLDGKPATTHWNSMDAMQQFFPKVITEPDSVITDCDGIYTSGGASSSHNLLIYLIDRFVSHDAALFVARLFAVDIDRANQAHFAIFQPLKKHGDDSIMAAQQLIESRYGDPKLTVEEVAVSVAVSKRNFIRRFKKATNHTPIQYIQRVRMEVAKRSLEASADSVQEIMYQVGYNDPKTFRQVFKRVTGLTPNQYKSKYSRNYAVAV